MLTLLLLLLAATTFAQPMQVCCGTLQHYPAFASQYVPSRQVWIWLPPDYSPQQRYPVIYFHDGQMLFDSAQTWNRQEWKVDETAALLIRQKQIPPFIAVGVANGGLRRYTEYFPAKALSYLPRAHRDTGMLRMVGKPLADDYLKFLVYELKPFVDSTYATLPGARHTFLAGASMGGLISLYGALEYPNVFGGAACLSTHWIGGFVPDTLIAAALHDYLADHLPKPGRIRLYFDYGTETLDRFYEPFQKHADRILQEAGYSPQNWMTRRFDGDEHAERAWSRRLAVPLVFLLTP